MVPSAATWSYVTDKGDFVTCIKFPNENAACVKYTKRQCAAAPEGPVNPFAPR
jgi:hypothetical protein